MDASAVLAAYDEQIRRDPHPDEGAVVERADGVVRTVDPVGGWNGVTWSDLDETTADAAIAATIARYAQVGRPWEWKHYAYDRPADLGDRLAAAGFTAEEPETVLAAEIAELDLDVRLPDGIELRPVEDEAGIRALVAVHDEVFGNDNAAIGLAVRAALGRHPRPMQAVVAYAGDVAVCGARVEFHDGTDFASIWGGGTLPEWRGKGIFRALVAYRARLAAERGFRHLQVDASPDSRPILGRLGFAELATTTPYTHPGVPDRLFHLVDRATWAAAVAAGEYRPPSLATEGFVHFSFAGQVAAVAAARFRGVPDLCAVEVDRRRLPGDARVVVEDSYGSGTAYPHVYGPVPAAAAVAVHDPSDILTSR